MVCKVQVRGVLLLHEIDQPILWDLPREVISRLHKLIQQERDCLEPLPCCLRSSKWIREKCQERVRARYARSVEAVLSDGATLAFPHGSWPALGLVRVKS